MLDNEKNLCPDCNSERFKQTVYECYYRFLDSNGEINSVEDDYNHDLELGAILCAKCGKDCTYLFEIDESD